MLAPKLYMVAVKPRSVFMVRAAKARFTRSIRHQMNIRNRNGRMRQATLRMVTCSRVSAMIVASLAHLGARFWLNGAPPPPRRAIGPAKTSLGASGKGGNGWPRAEDVRATLGGDRPRRLS